MTPTTEYAAPAIPWISDDEWNARARYDRDPKEAVFDPIWRLSVLYRIKDRKGNFVQFVPTPEQRVIIWDIHVRGIKNLIIPKARRLGISTDLMLIGFDLTLFKAGHKTVLVDKTLTDAKIKLSDMVRVAWDQLDDITRGAFEARWNKEELSLRLRHADHHGETSWRTFRVTVSGRGGEAHFLVVSEWGTIQFEDQARSNEIKTGAMIAAQFGTRVIETTWKGGKGGDVWAYVERALSKPDAQKDPKNDWFLRFFPWYLDSDYATPGDTSQVTRETHEYLDKMGEELSIQFTPAQRLWYHNQKSDLGLMMRREFPTVLRECWTAPIEGSIYGDALAKARTDGRVTDFPLDLSIPVDTFSDLGSPANTAMVFVQHINGRRHFIDFDVGLSVTVEERCRLLAQRGYRFGTHYIPHDGGAVQKGGKSYQTEFQDALRAAGLPDRVVIVPRTRDIWLGINSVVTMFPTFIFHSTKCARLLEMLEAYRRKQDPNDKEHFLDEVVHDYASHGADSVRCLGESKLCHFLPNDTGPIMTNAYFDPERLRTLSAASIPRLASQKLGIIVHPDQGRTNREKVFLHEANGNLRQWEAPRLGACYIITMAGKALAVWRAKERTQENSINPPAMVCAITPDPRNQQPLMADTAADLSGYYGRCMVVPDITSGPGWVEQLQALGTPLFSRMTTPQNRRVGTVAPVRKPGWETTKTPDMWTQACQELQAALHDFDIPCPVTLEQLAMIVSGPNDTPTTLEGSQSDWALAAAMAAVTLPLATPWTYNAPMASTRAPWDHGSETGWGGYGVDAEQAVLG